MNLENRIVKLETLIGVAEADAPLVFIKTVNCERGLQDEGTLSFAVIPGKIGSPHGDFLIRDANEAPDDFLLRCEKRYSEIYDK